MIKDELKDTKNVMLKDIASFSKGKNVSKNDVEENGEYYCIRYGELYTRYNEKITTIYSKTDKSDGLVRSKYGDVLIPSSGETAIDLATASTVLQDDIIIGGDINILRPNLSIINPLYLSYLLNSSQKYNIAKIAQGSSVIHVYNDQLKNLTFNIHTIDTQEKIAHLLSSIDDLIDGSTKLEELYILSKKNYMKQVFNENINLRYNGDVQKYNKVLLGDICSISTGNKDVKDSIEDGQYPFYIRSKKINRINTYSFDGEAILIGGDGNINDLIHYANGKFDYHQRVYKLSNFTSNGKYTYYYLTENIGKELMKNSANTTVDSVRMPTLTNFKMFFPDDLLEQDKIANLLTSMDDLIDYQNSITNEYIKLKKYYLNIIFK